MEWHWGNIGGALQGFGVLIVAIGALVKGPAVARALIDKKRAEAEAARAWAEAGHEQAETERLARRARLSGWSQHGVNSFSVELVKDPAEIDRARDAFLRTPHGLRRAPRDQRVRGRQHRGRPQPAATD